MGTLRIAGRIIESTAAPYGPKKFGMIREAKNSAGSQRNFNMLTTGHTTAIAHNYVVQDDGGVLTSYDSEADSAAANDVPLLPAAEQVNDAIYFGNTRIWNFIKFLIGTNGTGGTITWEYYNGAWVALTVTDGTTGFTAGTGIKEVSWAVPADWVANDVNGNTCYWVRARCTAANYSAQPLASRVWCGSNDKEELIAEVIADGTETSILIGTYKSTDRGIYDLYINDTLDSSGYDDYAASAVELTRQILLTVPLRRGWNKISLKLNSKNASSSDYLLGVLGIAVF